MALLPISRKGILIVASTEMVLWKVLEGRYLYGNLMPVRRMLYMDIQVP